MENKRLIVNYLLRCLQLTRAGEDIERIELDKSEQTALIVYRNGYRRPVNIACDSGIAIIRDITKAIE